ncbi:PLDc N-terminal domain-containing protein [Amnibacterium kyonggiense]|uniref:Phospholipase D-like protein n=1 Tax=Amnibacterium kyonggiense TaxID=595671 RepID=A0A4V3EB55_9MICO|nr:PLDc N-terminal domain-containing protein [Amnibacterium kyonggiense]TDS79644.1 phospholipase D-like protein [Amnibacterium kyonggiense]
MARVLVFAAIAAAVLTVFAVVDCALTERRRVRALPKWLWLLVALLLPVVGPLLWLLIGRGSVDRRPAPRVIGPDDDPAFLRSHGSRPRTTATPAPEPDEAQWQRLEQELANLDSDADDEGDAPRR